MTSRKTGGEEASFFFSFFCFFDRFSFLHFFDSFFYVFILFFHFSRFFFLAFLSIFIFPVFFFLAFLFLFFLFFEKNSLHSGRSKVTRVTVGRDIDQPTNQCFGVCKDHLATLKVAKRKEKHSERERQKEVTEANQKTTTKTNEEP